MEPGSVAIPDFIYFFVGCISLSIFLVLVAILGLRQVIVRHGSVITKKSSAY